MALEVARLALDRESDSPFTLLPFALTGPNMEAETFAFGDGRSVRLVRPQDRDSLQIPPGSIAVDFTEPAAALPNVEFYSRKGIPFVLGTTGYDRDRALELVRQSGTSAVIAPNMAIPIVLLQSAMHWLAGRFPGAMAGYQFGVLESHQSGKKDTSGTAKALVSDFAALGLPASVDKIKMIRDAKVQEQELNVPLEHISGHAYHFYEIASDTADIRLELSHRVHGRKVYAEGALTAVRFLHQKLNAGSKNEIFNMTDVLEAMPAPKKPG